jgi:superfamily II DNA or RNA helicase
VRPVRETGNDASAAMTHAYTTSQESDRNESDSKSTHDRVRCNPTRFSDEGIAVTNEDTPVLRQIGALSALALRTYAVNPGRVEEDANGERRISQGGYGDRQVFELVQNAADELRESEHAGGRVQVILTEDHLYCANEGAPITPEGAETILRMGVSRKRGGQVGRFGVGVKSVLSVSRTPEFFGASGSFGFDADWAATQILAAVNGARLSHGLDPMATLGETPVLRLARPLNADDERSRDRILDELLEWATTVVRLPLVRGVHTRLADDIHQARSNRNSSSREFPNLFQVFSHHVGTLVLEDRRTFPHTRRHLTVEHDGAQRTIHETRSGDKATLERFRVFTRAHEVSEQSRAGAGELHDRATIDISWAVPEYVEVDTERGDAVYNVRHERGLFWSFFPTMNPTTLSGALNAAWKTNEDRQNLLSGSPLNDELLEVAAELIVDSLPQLVVPDDPACYLPLLPGRAKESPNWACAFLTEQVWRLAAVSPSLPDQDGVLRKPDKLRITPEKLSKGALELWRAYPGRPTAWLHHSVDTAPIRRGKVNHILDATRPRIGPASIPEWLEALVADRTAAASAAALKLLAHLLDIDFRNDAAAEAEARQARILLTDTGEFVAPIAGQVYRRMSADGLGDDLVYIDQKISDAPDMVSHLERLGIREADAQGRFRSVLDQGFDGYVGESWVRFWQLLRTAGGSTQVRAIGEKVGDPADVLRVRTMAGRFSLLRDCLLPGPVIPPTGTRDRKLVVDIKFHSDDLHVLREFGMADRPTLRHRPMPGETWFDEYHRAVYDEYCSTLPSTASRPHRQTLRLEGSHTAGPLELFRKLSEEGKAAFLDAMPDEGLVENWTRQIGKHVNTRTAIESPIRWLLRHEGVVTTSKGLRPVAEAVGPQLGTHADVLPVALISPDKARKLGLPVKVDQVESSRWAELLHTVKESTDDAFVGATYCLLIEVAGALLAEEVELRCRIGDEWGMRPFGDVAVAEGTAEYDELRRELHPAVLVDAPASGAKVDLMVRELGLRRVGDVIEKAIRYVESSPAVPLADLYPPLRMRLNSSRLKGACLLRCNELEEVVRTSQGTRTTPLASARQDHTVLVPAAISDEDALIVADREFGWGLGRDDCLHVIRKHRQDLEDRALRRRIESIRNTMSIAGKIALLIDEDDLRRGLPSGLVTSEVRSTGREPDAHRLAEMAYNAHDDGILRQHADDITANFPNAPTRFDGGHMALDFVARLGLPDSFAGARAPQLPMREEVRGPRAFPALHDYQDRIATRLTDLLRNRVPGRAMLSLPTAAGKTRVASEGVIRWIREEGIPPGPILWIAETEELCEQAVQSWMFVWEKVGAEESLVIDRLWSTRSATPVSGRPHVVVATDAKLSSCLGDDEYAWLRDASLVLVDEAHRAISKRYTEILQHLGLTFRETPRHLVGLTATPFRNDADLTRRLVQRFGDTRLDKGIFAESPIPSLQRIGVLARVEHRELVGAKIHLNSDELKKLTTTAGFLPKAAEERLAEDEDRNTILLDEIAALPTDWPVLVFATSVQHAKYLAARLCDRGIKSRAIDSATPSAERRRTVDEFRKKKIRVITNYGVLSQGFDAPATRAVVIARPVYSANLYQQMVGRGLRGPRNGGSDTCLILDVRDNITNFDRELAFTEFEHLWQEQR